MTAVPHERLGPQGDALILELRRLQWALAREREDLPEQAAQAHAAHARPWVAPEAGPRTGSSAHPAARTSGAEQPTSAPGSRGGERRLEQARDATHATIAQLKPALALAQHHLRTGFEFII